MLVGSKREGKQRQEDVGIAQSWKFAALGLPCRAPDDAGESDWSDDSDDDDALGQS